MRHVTKLPVPPLLTAVYQNTPNLPWGNFHGQAKRDTRDSLKREQYYICGYCEISLDSMRAHIEHVEPKSGIDGNPARTYDYSNMLSSCQGDIQTPVASGRDQSCGHQKDLEIQATGAFVLADLVTPAIPNSADFFTYTLEGHIEPAHGLSANDRRKAEYTIQLLRLDCPRLRGARRHRIQRLVRVIDKVGADPTRLQQLVDHQLGAHKDRTDGKLKLREFYSARQQRLFP